MTHNKYITRVILNSTAVIALLLGTLLYILFRENAYFSIWVSDLVPLDGVRSAFSFADCGFLKYYLADYLWALSLASWLTLILEKIWAKYYCFAAFCITSCFGGVFELLQYSDLISGTGDPLDLVLYLSAGLTVNVITFLIRSKEK